MPALPRESAERWCSSRRSLAVREEARRIFSDVDMYYLISGTWRSAGGGLVEFVLEQQGSRSRGPSERRGLAASREWSWVPSAAICSASDRRVNPTAAWKVRRLAARPAPHVGDALRAVGRGSPHAPTPGRVEAERDGAALRAQRRRACGSGRRAHGGGLRSPPIVSAAAGVVALTPRPTSAIAPARRLPKLRAGCSSPPGGSSRWGCRPDRASTQVRASGRSVHTPGRPP